MGLKHVGGGKFDIFEPTDEEIWPGIVGAIIVIGGLVWLFG